MTESKAQSGKLEISVDEGKSWTQVVPSDDASADLMQTLVIKRIVFLDARFNDHKKILERLLWGDRLN